MCSAEDYVCLKYIISLPHTNIKIILQFGINQGLNALENL